MGEVCTDNRFEIIEKAKQQLLEWTNIDTSPDEMKVLDSFLFRCWQMGWLDRYDSKKYGHWIEEYLGYGATRYRCSKCGSLFGQDMIKEFNHNKYCSDCGTEMKD